MFETKEILIDGKIKSSYNFNVYETEFRKKLFCEVKGEKMNKKAVLQLINNIERIIRKEFPFDTNLHMSYLPESSKGVCRRIAFIGLLNSAFKSVLIGFINSIYISYLQIISHLDL